MGNRVVEAVGLSKTYAVPTSPVGTYRTLRDDLARALRRKGPGGSGTLIHAVRDLNFSLDAGESIGVLGRNGAGKSTLMKLLSRVTVPSGGYVDVAGRVGALLEVGTGFHPELTGRENVYLSGAILGLSKRDVAGRFEDIVDFSELAEFIDMPVKRYSSGMYARLGFAVAAHLRPALLIVDEVLSVGDLPFQAKCLAHMKKLTRDGVAILFVSHSLRSVADFCDRVLVMECGRLTFDGGPNPAIAHYRSSLGARSSRSGTDGSVLVNGARPDWPILIDSGSPLRVDLPVPRPVSSSRSTVTLNLVIETEDGRLAIHLRNDLQGTELAVGPGANLIGVTIDSLPLAPGDYWLWLRVVGGDPASPTMWDTERLMLTVDGDRSIQAVVQPQHRFHARSVAAPAPSVSGLVGPAG